MTPPLPFWIEAIVAALLLLSAVFTLAAGWGVVRLRDFFLRLHPPALVSVWASWCVCLASVVYFSVQAGEVQLHVWLIIILLSITMPITTLMLARAGLFRGRQAGRSDLPAPLLPLTESAPDANAPAPGAPAANATTSPADGPGAGGAPLPGAAPKSE